MVEEGKINAITQMKFNETFCIDIVSEKEHSFSPSKRVCNEQGIKQHQQLNRNDDRQTRI